MATETKEAVASGGEPDRSNPLFLLHHVVTLHYVLTAWAKCLGLSLDQSCDPKNPQSQEDPKHLTREEESEMETAEHGSRLPSIMFSVMHEGRSKPHTLGSKRPRKPPPDQGSGGKINSTSSKVRDQKEVARKAEGFRPLGVL